MDYNYDIYDIEEDNNIDKMADAEIIIYILLIITPIIYCLLRYMLVQLYIRYVLTPYELNNNENNHNIETQLPSYNDSLIDPNALPPPYHYFPHLPE
jgi:hypothetical protein